MELRLLSLNAVAIALLAAACAGRPPLAPSAAAPDAAPPPSGGTRAAAHAGTRPPPSPQAAAPEDPSHAPGVEASPGAPAPGPLPRGTTVLHIGDSMAGALGIELNAQLARAGVRGVLSFKNASFIPTWAWSAKLPLLLASHEPDLVIVTLGANELRVRRPGTRAELIRKLVRRLEGRPCVWITPPLWSADNGLLAVIQENAAPCRYLDTNLIYSDMPRIRDKIHPTMAARREWARRVIDWLARERKVDGTLPWQLRPESSGSLWLPEDGHVRRLELLQTVWRPHGDSNPGYRRERPMS
jgi:lysophospholipase L1-like esterase